MKRIEDKSEYLHSILLTKFYVFSSISKIFKVSNLNLVFFKKLQSLTIEAFLRKSTAKIIWNQSEAILWGKMLIFKRAFYKLRLLPQLCPPQNFWLLMRAFKWGTMYRFISRGIRMVKGQSSRLLILLNKKWVFQNF